MWVIVIVESSDMSIHGWYRTLKAATDYADHQGVGVVVEIQDPPKHLKNNQKRS